MTKTAKQLNQEIKSTKLYKEYVSLKELCSKDKEILNLLDLIGKVQKEAKDALNKNDMKQYKESCQKMNMLKQEFINNPIINNYNEIRNELENLLEQIAIIISEE